MSDGQQLNAAELLAYLGINFTVNEGELISGAIITARVIDADGDVLIRSAWSDGLDIFQRVGMLRTAERQEFHDLFGSDD